MLFQLVPGVFLCLINQNNSNTNWKKILELRNMQFIEDCGISRQKQAKKEIVLRCGAKKCFEKQPIPNPHLLIQGPRTQIVISAKM